jgi:hypothetical protein
VQENANIVTYGATATEALDAFYLRARALLSAQTRTPITLQVRVTLTEQAALDDAHHYECEGKLWWRG